MPIRRRASEIVNALLAIRSPYLPRNNGAGSHARRGWTPSAVTQRESARSGLFDANPAGARQDLAALHLARIVAIDPVPIRSAHPS